MTADINIFCGFPHTLLETLIASANPKQDCVAHPLLVGHDLARHEDEADLEDHSEELEHEVVDGDEPQQVVEGVHFRRRQKDSTEGEISPIMCRQYSRNRL